MKNALYASYLEIWKQGLVCAGFSPRLPDRGTRYWLEQLERILPARAGSFLDIGAGGGRLSLLLGREWGSGIALEVQVDAQVWAAIQEHYPVLLREGLLQKTMDELVGTMAFDVVLLSEVFEHIPPIDVPQFLRTLHALLADEGTLFLTTPNVVVQGPAEKSSMWHERQLYGHHKHYALSELKSIFEKHGFAVQSYCFECHTLKRHLYNRCFYAISRLDGRLMASSKVPKRLKFAYRLASAPLIVATSLFFRLVAAVVYYVEKNWSNEKNCLTIIMSIKKMNRNID